MYLLINHFIAIIVQYRVFGIPDIVENPPPPLKMIVMDEDIRNLLPQPDHLARGIFRCRT